MNYFRINLNQLEDKSAVQKRKRREAAAFVLPAATFFMLAASMLFLTMKTYAKKQHFAGTAEQLNAQIRELEQGEQFVGEGDVSDLYDATQERIFWTEKLEILADVVDTTVALTELTYANGKFYIRGIAPASKETSRFGAIAGFIDRLKKRDGFSGDFSRIDFSSSDRVEYMGKQIMNFEVICSRE